MSIPELPTAHKWEQIAPETDRMRVPGGWLYKFTLYTRHGALNEFQEHSVALTFVPNPCWHAQSEPAS